jgi:ABC-type branched-subunit amino acid transport system substrate-binding protein
MPIMRNTLITLLIAALIGLWIVLHPAEKQAAFELNDAHLAKGPLIALVISRTGHGRDVGEAVEHGVRHYVSKLMAHPERETMGLITFDDQSNPIEARRIAGEIAANPRVVAVLGHTDNATTLAAMPVYTAAGIPMLTPTADAHEITEGGDWAFSTVMSDAEQGQFLAFYVEQAMEGKQVVMFAHEANMTSSRITQFHKTAEAEKIKVIGYPVPDHQEHLNNDERKGLTATIKQLDPDVIFLSLTADHTEDLLVALKDMGYKKRIIANGPVGTPYFARRFADMAKEKEAPGYYTNGVVVPVPFMLDIANNLAHEENEMYHAQYGHDMSWPFAYGYDAAQVLVEAMHRFHTAVTHGAVEKGTDRVGIRNALQGMNHATTGVFGLTGTTFFNEQGAGERPPLFGRFRARSLTSALNQFAAHSMPLEHYDPLEHIKHIEVDGEVFGLSDVVYTGVKFRHLEKFDIEKRTAFADFEIWFRYHGQFDPADIVFDNAMEGSLSMAVLDEHVADHIQYKKIRVKATFYFHLTPVDFLQHKVDLVLSFQHRKMNRNELIYVVDRSAYNTQTNSTFH